MKFTTPIRFIDKTLKYIILLFTACNSTLFASHAASKVFSSIKDIKCPTTEEYKRIEHFLQKGKRPNVDKMSAIQYKTKAKYLKLISSSNEVIHKIVPINCEMEHKENCIVLYCSWNYHYPESQKKLLKILEQSDYIGHVIFRIGGFPNLEGGDLPLCVTPYAFKVCAFMEAYRLGYKRALWLDASIRPHVSLNKIFEKIEEMHFFAYHESSTQFKQLISSSREGKVYGLSNDNINRLYTIQLGVVGIDFTDKTSLAIFKEWYNITKSDSKACYTHFIESTLLSYIVNQHYPREYFPIFFEKIYCPDHDLGTARKRPTPETLEFSYDKKEVEPEWPYYNR